MSKHAELKTLAQAYIDLIDSPDEDSWVEARDMYDDAASADTVLALIKEHETLLAAAERFLQFRHTGDVGMGYQYSGVHPETELKAAIAVAKGDV